MQLCQYLISATVQMRKRIMNFSARTPYSVLMRTQPRRGFRNKKKLVEENKKLQGKVDELTAENSRLTQSVSELDRLKKLYDLDKEYSEYDKVGAEVISKNSGL